MTENATPADAQEPHQDATGGEVDPGDTGSRLRPQIGAGELGPVLSWTLESPERPAPSIRVPGVATIFGDGRIDWEGEPRFTLDEARAELARHECQRIGHEWSYECSRCGAYASVDVTPAADDREKAERLERAEAAVARVRALVEEWEATQAYNRQHIGTLLRDTPGPADFRRALDGTEGEK